jgi:hypothetical protein
MHVIRFNVFWKCYFIISNNSNIQLDILSLFVILNEKDC